MVSKPIVIRKMISGGFVIYAGNECMTYEHDRFEFACSTLEEAIGHIRRVLADEPEKAS